MSGWRLRARSPRNQAEAPGPDYFPVRAFSFDVPLGGATKLKIIKFPTYQMPAGRGPLYGRYFLDYPMSLVKTDGVWREIVTPSQDELSEADNYYIGGYYYPPLSDDEAADLPAEYVEEV